MTTDDKALPKYKSHKIVEAFKIGEVFRFPDSRGAELRPVDSSLPNVTVNKRYLEKHEPKVGGYYVRYPDGYESWSPKEAFEDGYTEVNLAPEGGAPMPTVGRIVQYVLDETDEKEINEHDPDLGRYANPVQAGEIVPMLITKVWGSDCVNGQVMIDGNFSLWRTSVTLGHGYSHWQWPPRV